MAEMAVPGFPAFGLWHGRAGGIVNSVDVMSIFRISETKFNQVVGSHNSICDQFACL